MAAEMDASSLDLSEYNTLAIIRIQAFCRGWLVRNQLKGAQEEFQQIVKNLEGENVDVEWTERILPLPVVLKSSKNKKYLRKLKAKKENYVSSENAGKISRSPICAQENCTHNWQGLEKEIQTDLSCLLSEEVTKEDNLKTETEIQKHDLSQVKADSDFISVSGGDDGDEKNTQKSLHTMADSQVAISEANGKTRVMDGVHGDQTSVWDSSSSLEQHTSGILDLRLSDCYTSAYAVSHHEPVNVMDFAERDFRSQSTQALLRQRQNIAMELLWVQQAIISRKKYLTLKSQMETTSSL